ncbi:uncharacterized protein BCR38DRAFT_490485 [Pseudomassariella vexata]|uniref:FAD-binding domain-containing protein n=1 Tax=Pseudomassariella vexata TaxID=1141098 RepID=A0A1Y2DBE1_9PEZI|nr:uncharacterized protein BCR38DRAFT_490485 [Pseudomassariella vexata]ORY56593.1 hypothetical protein BCR38DRAFT_490485 [Pseudomassariella vexata]
MTVTTPSCKPFRVIIAGGSICGLSLALVLEKAGIDYVLLEKRDIAPQLGASIGFSTHGVRIMEQMGIWDDIRAIINPLQDYGHYEADGTLFYTSQILPEIRKVTNRPQLLMSRQTWLQVVHSHIKDQRKIHSRTGVASYTQNDEGIVVTADNGETFEGSILVGADGIHSITRSLVADEVEKVDGDAKAAKQMKEGFAAHYHCIFATSKNEYKNQPGKPIMPEANVADFSGKDHCGLVAAGMPGQLFWFFYLKSADITNTPFIPKYREEDAEEAMRVYGGAHVGPECTFKDLWDARVSSNMKALEEGVMKTKWSRGRVVLMGDSVHKVNTPPISPDELQRTETAKCTINTGLGGQLALEGICNLTNGLVELLKTSPSPSSGEITQVFTNYETKQRPRAEWAMSISGHQTRMESQANWIYWAFGRLILPRLPDWLMAVGTIKSIYVGSPCMEFLLRPADILPPQKTTVSAS